MSAGLRVLLLAAVLAALALGVAQLGSEPPRPQAARPGEAAAPGADGFEPLPNFAAEAGGALLSRSPFAPDRSAYAREGPAPAPRRQVEVRLVGVLAVGGAPRATLLIDGRETDVGVGDDTPAGRVADIEPDAVVLGEPTARRVGLFE